MANVPITERVAAIPHTSVADVRPPAPALSAVPPPSFTVRRRWVWRLLQVMMALLVLYIARGLWLAPIIANYVANHLNQTFGASVGIRGVEGNFLTNLTLVGLTIHDGTRTPLRRLQASSLRLGFSLVEWLSGDPRWLKRLDLDSGIAEFDSEGREPATGPIQPDIWLFRVWPDAHLGLERVTFRAGQHEWRLEGVTLDFRDGRLSLSAARTDGNGFAESQGHALAAVAERRMATATAPATWVIERADLGSRPLARRLHVVRLADGVGIVGDLWLGAGQATISAVWPTTARELGDCTLHEARLENVAVAEWLPEHVVAIIGAEPRGTFTGQITGPWARRAANATLRINGQWRDGVCGGRSGQPWRLAFQTLQVDATWIEADQRWIVNELDLAAGRDRIGLRGVMLRWDAATEAFTLADEIRGGVTAQLGDLNPVISGTPSTNPVSVKIELAPNGEATRVDVQLVGDRIGSVTLTGSFKWDNAEFARRHAAAVALHYRRPKRRESSLSDWLRLIGDAWLRANVDIDNPGRWLGWLGSVWPAWQAPLSRFTALNGSVNARLDFTQTGDGTQGSLRVEAHDLAFNQQPLGRLTLAANWSNQAGQARATLEQLAWTPDPTVGAVSDGLRMAGGLNLTRAALEHLTASVRISELANYSGVANALLTAWRDIIGHSGAAPTLWDAASPAQWRGALALSLTGRSGGSAQEWRGDWALTGQRLVLGGWWVPRLSASGEVSATAIRVAVLDSLTVFGQWRAAGVVDWSGINEERTLRLTLDTLSYFWRELSLTLTRSSTLAVHVEGPNPLVWRIAAFALAEPLRLSGTLGQVQVYAAWQRNPERLEFSLHGANVSLQPWVRFLPADLVPPSVDGNVLELVLTVAGPINDLVWDFRLTARDIGMPANDPHTAGALIRGRVRLWLTGSRGEARIDEAVVAMSAGQFGIVDSIEQDGALGKIVIRGRAPFNPAAWLKVRPSTEVPWRLSDTLTFGEVDLTAALTLPDLSRWRTVGASWPLPKGLVSLTLGLQGTWRQPLLAGQFDATGLDATRIFVDQWRAALPVELEPMAERLAELSAVRVESKFALLRDTPAAPDAGPDWLTWSSLHVERAWIDFGPRIGWMSVSGRLQLGSQWLELAALQDGTLNVACDISELSRLPLPVRSPVKLDGALTASLRMTLPLSRPQCYGEARWTGGRLMLSAESPPLTHVNLHLTASGRELMVRQGQALLGEGPLTLSGTASLVPAPERLVCRFDLTGRELLLWRDRGVLVRADADLKLTGPLTALGVAGTLELARGELSRGDTWLSLFAADADGELVLPKLAGTVLDSVALDVAIKTPTPLKIRTPDVSGFLSCELRVGGTLAEPRPVGRVWLRHAYLAVPAGMLSNVTATLGFDATQRSAQPSLDLSAEIALHGYRIQVEIGGQWNRPNLRLTSTPPLAPDQLLLLLLGNSPESPRDVAPNGLASAEAVAVYIGPQVLRRVFGENTTTRERVLERIEIQPASGISESGRPTFTIRLVVATDLVQPNDRLAVELSRDYYDDYNAGITFILRLR